MPIASFGAGQPARIDSSGIRALLEAVHAEFIRRTGTKAYVVPDATQILLRGEGELRVADALRRLEAHGHPKVDQHRQRAPVAHLGGEWAAWGGGR